MSSPGFPSNFFNPGSNPAPGTPTSLFNPGQTQSPADPFTGVGSPGGLTGIISNLNSLAGNTGIQGTGATNQGLSGLTDVMNFWKTLMTGNRTQLMSVLGPQIGTISSQYQAARKQASQTGPRSGGTAAVNEESRFGEASAIQNLLEGGQLAGAEGLGKTSAAVAGVGTTEQSNTLSAFNTELQAMLGQKGIQGQSSAALGQGIGQTLAMMALML